MRVLVVGAGVVGLCCAWYLTQAGHEATLIDSGPMEGDRCSLGNSGIIVPSHFVPLASPGMVLTGLKMMMKRDSPFRIKPSLDQGLASWCLQFQAHCNESHVEQCAPILLNLHRKSRELFRQFSKDWDNPFGFQERGLLMLCHTHEGIEEEAEVALHAHRLGMEARVISGDEIFALEPDLGADVLGGVEFPEDAHVSPHLFVAHLKLALMERGVQFLWSNKVTSLVAGSQPAVQLDHQTLNADAIIVAAGAASGKLAKTAGVNLPLQPGKGMSFSLTENVPQLTRPLLLKEARLAVTPMVGGVRIGGTMELGEWNLSIDLVRLGGMKTGLSTFLPKFKSGADSVSEGQVWSGLRPCSPDGMPYLGGTDRAPGIFFATGHGMMGVSLAPITGQMMVEILEGSKPPAQISVDRYN